MDEVDRKLEKKYIAMKLPGIEKRRNWEFLKMHLTPKKTQVEIQVRFQQLIYSQMHLLKWHDNSMKEAFRKWKQQLL